MQAGAGIVADSDPEAEYEEMREQGARGAARGRDGARAREGRRSESMLLVIDNYDSFTYNLVQYLGELGAEVRVVRNDEITVDDIAGAGAARAS